MTSRAELPQEMGTGGRFVRQSSQFRDWVERSDDARYPAAAGRYHLYVSYACPWAHRTIILRRLKGLEEIVGVSVVDPIRDERGWAFREGPNHGVDPINGFGFLAEAYLASDSSFASRVTVPVLWDTESGRIVSNESADILQMLNSAFDEWGDTSLDLYPEELRAQIDEVNAFVYGNVNDGVYKCGFATTQGAYEEAFDALFSALDQLEGRLSGSRYLVGDRITLADWRLFTTLVRFDPVYVGHFKCNLRRIADYPNLSGYLRELFQVPGVAETVDMDHIKRHYYETHRTLNPKGIVPKGPEVDLRAPHGRESAGR